MLIRPEKSEYDAFYSTYIDKVPAGDILALLPESAQKTLDLLAEYPEDREQDRYAPGKWTIRELMGHIVDTERLFAYRAAHFARADPAALPGMDQDVWAANSNASGRALSDLCSELASVRAATISLFASFDGEISIAKGMASGCQFTVRSLAYIIAGHEIHHRKVAEERYFDWK